MLKLIPKSWFSWDFSVTDGASTIAEIDVSWWREKGVLTVHGSTFVVRLRTKDELCIHFL